MEPEEVDKFERIYACVNACVGMLDPAKEIAAKDARIAELEAALSQVMSEVNSGLLHTFNDRMYAAERIRKVLEPRP